METSALSPTKLSHTKRLSHDEQGRIRSFVIRAGRMSERKLQGLEYGLKAYGVAYQHEPIELASVFGREAETVLEIGFGMGATLLQQALAEPEKNFIGVEVHPPGVANLCALLQENNSLNVRIIQHDAIEVVRDMLKNDSLARIQVYFPDPWPKFRHHKRRILQPDFIALLTKKLQANGLFHVATDWVPYATEVLSHCEVTPQLLNSSKGFVDKPDFRPVTKFEQRGLKIGHEIRDILFYKSY